MISEHLKNRLKEKHLPHGLILAGDRRQDLAEYLSMAFVCEGEQIPCEQCTHCRKASAGIHPDVIHVGGTQGEALKVDDIRALRSDAYIRPNEAERKVYLLQNAETMNQSGQNALLKLLEEGPDYAAFLFLTPNPEQLLPTVRSRCETIYSEAALDTVAPSEAAKVFADLLCTQAPLALVEFCVGLEKKKREELTALLDETIALLVPRLGADPEGLLPKLQVLQEVRGALDFTIGSGHVAGWLLAALSAQPS